MTQEQEQDPRELEDEAAELDDDDEQDEAPGGDGDDHDDEGAPVTGIVTGGPPPYPGLRVTTRCPGLVLVDKQRGLVWVFDHTPAGEGAFTCRDDAGAPLADTGRWKAAESADWEIRAYDDEFDGDDPPGSTGSAADGGAEEWAPR